LLLALLGGSAFVDAPRVKWLVIATTAMIGFGLGWMYTATDPTIPQTPTVRDIGDYEHRTGVVGTTTAAEYLPKWVEERPADESLQAAYAEGLPIKRFDLTSLPQGGQVLEQTAGVLGQTVKVESPSAFAARFNLFYFPGWTATVDGVNAVVEPEAKSGLALVQVPAGTHTVTVQFEDTQPRTIGWMISGVALLILLGLGVWSWRGAENIAGTRTKVGEEAHDGLMRGPMVAVAIVGLALMGIKLLYADRPGSFFLQKRFDGQMIPGVQHRADLAFGDVLELLGYEEGPAGEISLYWHALRPIDTDWSVSVTLDYAGDRVAQDDVQHPAGMPTQRWTVYQYAQDTHTLMPAGGTPPGLYDLRVTVYRQSDGLILQPAGALIGQVQVGRPATPSLVTPPTLVDVHFGPIVLYGVDVPKEVRNGEDLPIRMFWRADGTTQEDIKPVVQLVNKAGAVTFSSVVAPVETGYGTRQWQAGDGWVGNANLPLRADMPGGLYTLQMMTPEGPRDLADVTVLAPKRVYDLPKPMHPLSAQFDKVAKLLGWDYETGQLTLYWQALETPTTRYSVFVHVWGPDLTITDQRDSVPVNGTRPTTSWLAGEILTDTYSLTIPEDTYRVEVGLYDPAVAGGQLTTSDGNAFVNIYSKYP
jgi:hypothetical protein